MQKNDQQIYPNQDDELDLSSSSCNCSNSVRIGGMIGTDGRRVEEKVEASANKLSWISDCSTICQAQPDRQHQTYSINRHR